MFGNKEDPQQMRMMKWWGKTGRNDGERDWEMYNIC